MAIPEFIVGGGASIGTLVGHVIADISGLTSGLSRATTHLRLFSGQMDKYMKDNVTAMRRMGRQAVVVGAAIVGAAGMMTKSYGEFEHRMRRAVAVTDATEEQFKKMSDAAEAASRKLNIAATSAADAFYYLGSAGLTVTEQMQAFPGVAALSKAAVIDMDRAAEMMVDTIKAYREDFSKTTEITDIFTEAVISSNMTFAHLGETMGMVGTVGKRTNNSIAELTAMIGLMANVGIKGTVAGSSLRRALLNLAAPTSEVREELRKWNIEVYDAEGRMKPMVQIIGEMGEILKNATEEQKNFAFRTLFGVRAITGQMALFDLGIDKVQAYVDRIKNAGGATETVAKRQMAAFLERVGKASQSVLTLSRHIGMSLAPALSRFADYVKETTDKIIIWVDAHKDITMAITATVAVMGAAILAAGTLTLGLASLTLAATALGVSVGMLAGVISATTLGIGALAGAAAYIALKFKSFSSEIKELKKDLKFDEPIQALQDAMKRMRPFLETQNDFAESVFNRMYKTWLELEKIRKDTAKALDATREELFKMAKEYEMAKPSPLILTAVLRSSVLRELTGLRDIYAQAVEGMVKTVDAMSEKADEKTVESIRKQMTIFELAMEERKRERQDEYDSWVENTAAWAGTWSEAEYERVKITRQAYDDMEGATTGFLTSTMMDITNWKDAIIGFLQDIQRAIIQAFAQVLVTELLKTSTANLITGLLTAPLRAGVGAGAGAGGAEAQWGGAYQHGGIATRPQLAKIGETPEAIIPLSGGRAVPVEMTGRQGGMNLQPQIKVVIVRNEKEAQIEAMNSPEGERVIIQKIIRNRNLL